MTKRTDKGAWFGWCLDGQHKTCREWITMPNGERGACTCPCHDEPKKDKG